MLNNNYLFPHRSPKEQHDTKLDHDIQQEIDRQIIADAENIKINDAFKNWYEVLLDD